MRPFWHNTASWAEKPRGFPTSFLNTIIITIATTIIIDMILFSQSAKLYLENKKKVRYIWKLKRLLLRIIHFELQSM